MSCYLYQRAIGSRHPRLLAPAEAPSDEILEWSTKDNRRFLRAVYRVGDLDRTIEYVK